MAWNSSVIMQMGRFLLLVILYLPREMTSSVLTVNGKTENYILDTTPGSQVSLICAVQNHTREEELLWYREEGRVDLKSGNKINSSSVCVSSISENDNGISFTCRLGRDPSVSISVALNVIFPPLLSGNDFQTVEEGSNVKLVCSVKANPQAQMMWYKNSSLLDLEKSHHQIQQTSESFQLSITKVEKSDNGTYSCTAKSSLQTESLDFHLIVKDKTVSVPAEPIIAACVVIFLTLCFGLIARRKKIMELCMKDKDPHRETAL
ncbi:PREDICTED: transmembrane and immunoglobulin domain-containing protein 1 [Rhinopithecus bieti]|uniref:Transmembrane and immunoglobulin domain-containing protein 1 n=1 Tax=Rhinopithecus bieti TaxID=61621 RepID=A0A2K6JSY9_RHIBE|nr:PREDICTED: transmembrane and immunoglobulin domain-containing protein 1 [Rhinopithecus bieti]XP_017710556.1 PREDICTED: transmembrane and immunoglobulin domain-containing protein 1 [Rhinopithecus bieti]